MTSKWGPQPVELKVVPRLTLPATRCSQERSRSTPHWTGCSPEPPTLPRTPAPTPAPPDTPPPHAPPQPATSTSPPRSSTATTPPPRPWTQAWSPPAHATVILQAASELPTGVSDQQRHEIEAALLDKAQRFDPDQLRRIARRSIETIEPDQTAVDAHENDLLRSEEATARNACTLTLHDNHDGTTTGHFTVPALAAAMLRKVIEFMTAPRRMRPGAPGSTEDNRSFDWRHRRGLAFADLLEHLPGAAHAAGPTEIASLSPSDSSPAGV